MQTFIKVYKNTQPLRKGQLDLYVRKAYGAISLDVIAEREQLGTPQLHGVSNIAPTGRGSTPRLSYLLEWPWRLTQSLRLNRKARLRHPPENDLQGLEQIYRSIVIAVTARTRTVFWGPFWVSLQLFCRSKWVTLGALRGHFGVILELFWLIFGSFRVILASFGQCFTVVSVSFWLQFWVNLWRFFL